jgi:hypothetical protein
VRRKGASVQNRRAGFAARAQRFPNLGSHHFPGGFLREPMEHGSVALFGLHGSVGGVGPSAESGSI